MVDSQSQGRLDNFSNCNFTHQLPANICRSGLRSRRRSVSSQRSSKSVQNEQKTPSKSRQRTLKQSKSAKTLKMNKSFCSGTVLNQTTLTAHEEQKKVSHVLKKSRNKDFLGIGELLQSIGTNQSKSQQTLQIFADGENNSKFGESIENWPMRENSKLSIKIEESQKSGKSRSKSKLSKTDSAYQDLKLIKNTKSRNKSALNRNTQNYQSANTIVQDDPESAKSDLFLNKFYKKYNLL